MCLFFMWQYQICEEFGLLEKVYSRVFCYLIRNGERKTRSTKASRKKVSCLAKLWSSVSNCQLSLFAQWEMKFSVSGFCRIKSRFHRESYRKYSHSNRYFIGDPIDIGLRIVKIRKNDLFKKYVKNWWIFMNHSILKIWTFLKNSEELEFLIWISQFVLSTYGLEGNVFKLEMWQP